MEALEKIGLLTELESHKIKISNTKRMREVWNKLCEDYNAKVNEIDMQRLKEELEGIERNINKYPEFFKYCIN